LISSIRCTGRDEKEAKVKHNNDDKDELAEGTLVSHLLELRQRIIKAILAVVLVFLCLLPFVDPIFKFVSKPLTDALPAGSSLVSIGIVAPLMTPIKTTLYVAIFLAMPAVLYQIWRFVAPGLYKREQRSAFPLLATSIALFYIGVAFAYFIVIRMAFPVLIAMTPDNVLNLPDIDVYLSFILMFFLAFGIAFQVPVLTFVLAWTGLASVESMKVARPYVLIGAFVVGMLLTPAEVISQISLAVPVYLLFESGLLVSRFLLRDRPKQDDTGILCLVGALLGASSISRLGRFSRRPA
jgi:sec-independent protein translocase protein TatC